jgi:SnoaL-like domain
MVETVMHFHPPAAGSFRWFWGERRGTIASMAQDMEEIAALVRKAMASEDVAAFAELLGSEVTWGPPGARNRICKNRNEVLAWYEKGRDAGVRGSVYDVQVLGDRLLVSMSVTGTDEARKRGGTALRFQVLTVRHGRIVDIVGFEDKVDALLLTSGCDCSLSRLSIGLGAVSMFDDSGDPSVGYKPDQGHSDIDRDGRPGLDECHDDRHHVRNGREPTLAVAADCHR